MALIECPECGREVSDKAAACPHCGMPLAPAASTPTAPPIPQQWGPPPAKPDVYADSLAYQKRSAMRIAVAAVGGLILILIMVTCSQSEVTKAPTVTKAATPPTPADSAAERQRYLTGMGNEKVTPSQRVWAANQLIANYPNSEEATTARSELPKLQELVRQESVGKQWTYSSSPDSMSGKEAKTAWVESNNAFNFDFPYSGSQKATLRVRRHPRWGNDIMFSIEKGQILCHSFSGCPIRVRFDDEKAVTYEGTGPDDNSSEMVFLPAYAMLTSKMAKAKIMRVEVNVYQQGSIVGEFNVEGFKPEKLE